MKILKFGGSSLATPDRMRRVAGIVGATATEGALPIVVVSAMGGVTNELLQAAADAAQRQDAWIDRWTELRSRHLEAAESVASEDGDRESLTGWIRERWSDLEDLLHGVFLLRECSPRTRDSIVAFGERTSAVLLARCLTTEGLAATAVDARKLIVTDDAFGAAQVEIDATRRAIQRWSQDLGSTIPVVTGFIAATERGETTTLGRGGSDYTASILGEALAATVIELWTDVSGVLSADPRKVSEAFPLPQISYDELMELSHFGAKVVHPPSVHPARRGGIPLAIRNTLEPSAPGTLISETSGHNRYPVRGISSIAAVDLLRLEGDGMVGVPGIAMRLFGCLAQADVSVVLISQASSEHSICFAVAPEATERAERAVAREFALEIQVGAVNPMVVDRDLSVLAVVGEGMRERPGLASQLFSALGRHRINVRAVAQGSSELNISLVVAAGDEVSALRAVHSTFFCRPLPRIDLVLLGYGGVGREVWRQSQRVLDAWSERGIDVRWIGLANSQSLLLDEGGIDLSDGPARLRGPRGGGLPRLVEFLSDRAQPTLVLDATASDQVADFYPALLAAGHGIIAANKKPFCGPWEQFLSWQQTAAAQRSLLRLEATVGAGLPVISTLTGQLAAGDRLVSIVGVVSGSLSFLCEALHQGQRLSEALQEADRRGYLEPNPWDDLSGEDARRKLCILARLAGFPLELTDIECRPFLDDSRWAAMEPEAFWQRLPELDDAWEHKRLELEARERRWRYLIHFENGHGTVGLQEVAPEHPCYGTQGPESMVAFQTEHYHERPLVVRGPGAGPAVTASGMLVDVVHALQSIAATLPISEGTT